MSPSAAPNPVTEKGGRWISSAAPLTYPRSTQVSLFLPVSHFAPHCRIMSLQGGILRLSESRCVDASCLILWPNAGGKTEGHRMRVRNNPWVWCWHFSNSQDWWCDRIHSSVYARWGHKPASETLHAHHAQCQMSRQCASLYLFHRLGQLNVLISFF